MYVKHVLQSFKLFSQSQGKTFKMLLHLCFRILSLAAKLEMLNMSLSCHLYGCDPILRWNKILSSSSMKLNRKFSQWVYWIIIFTWWSHYIVYQSTIWCTICTPKLFINVFSVHLIFNFFQSMKWQFIYL